MQSVQEQLDAVRKEGWRIQFIEDPSLEVQLAAVNKCGHALRFIENPFEEVQLAAVNRNGYAIKYLKNPSEAVQLAAVSRDGLAIEYIENPTEKVLQSVEEDPCEELQQKKSVVATTKTQQRTISRTKNEQLLYVSDVRSAHDGVQLIWSANADSAVLLSQETVDIIENLLPRSIKKRITIS